MSHRHFANIPNSCHTSHFATHKQICKYVFLLPVTVVVCCACCNDKKSNYMEFNIFHKKTSKKQGGMPENFLVSMFLHFFNIKTLKL